MLFKLPSCPKKLSRDMDTDWKESPTDRRGSWLLTFGTWGQFSQEWASEDMKSHRKVPWKGLWAHYSLKLSQMAQETRPQTRSLSPTRDLLPVRAGSGHRGTGSTGLNGVKREAGGYAQCILSLGWEGKAICPEHLSANACAKVGWGMRCSLTCGNLIVFTSAPWRKCHTPTSQLRKAHTVSKCRTGTRSASFQRSTSSHNCAVQYDSHQPYMANEH